MKLPDHKKIGRLIIPLKIPTEVKFIEKVKCWLPRAGKEGYGKLFNGYRA